MSKKRLTFGPGASGAGSGARNMGATPADMVPTIGEASAACMDLMALLPSSHHPPGAPFDGVDAAAGPIMRAAWMFLLETKVPELWPYADNTTFNPGYRARFLRAIATLDLWVFRPRVPRPVIRRSP